MNMGYLGKRKMKEKREINKRELRRKGLRKVERNGGKRKGRIKKRKTEEYSIAMPLFKKLQC